MFRSFVAMLVNAAVAGSVFASQGDATISGAVVDITTAAIANAKVRLINARGSDEHVLSDAEGRFGFSGVTPGMWALEVVAPGFESRRIEHVEIAESEHRDLGPIVLQVKPINGCSAPVVNEKPGTWFETLPRDDESEIAGTVVGERGEPIKRALVVISRNGRRSQMTHTDSHGNFSMTGVPTGKYTVRVKLTWHADFIVRDVEVEAGLRTRIGNLILYPCRGRCQPRTTVPTTVVCL